ncbi:MAG: hypothetical protein K9N51_05540, partial [Candidatus Pacebacteria bacterium]|nr:hypothetical protein [Candidatus Paceibacterota bacterium]
RVMTLPKERAIPAQVEVISYHPDQSVRWLRVHFNANPGTSYAVRYGPETTTALNAFRSWLGPVFGTSDSDARQSPAALSVQHKGRDIVVGNGTIRAVFSSDASAGLSRLEHVADQASWSITPERMRLIMTGPEGRAFPAGNPESLRLEAAGPQYAAIRAEGHFQADDGEPLMHYILRWRFHAGMPGVDIELTVGNDRDEEKYACFPPSGKATSACYSDEKPLNWYFVKIRDLYLEVDVPEDGRTSVGRSELKDWGEGWWRKKEEKGLTGRYDELGYGLKAAGTGAWRLFQKDANSVVAGEGSGSPARLDGRMLWKGENQSLGIRVDRFWQQYPKSFERTEKTLRIGIMPRFEPEDYPLVGVKDEEKKVLSTYSATSRSHFYLRNGLYRFMYGKQKTHRLSLVFGPDADKRISASRVLPATAFFLPSPAYNCSTQAFGDFQRIRAEDGSYPAVNQWIADRLAQILAGRDYGMLNYGDIWGERTPPQNWLGPQRDFAQKASQEFWRTGNPQWLSLAYEAALHFADVDTIHYGPNKGFQVMHAVGHTGKEYVQQDGYDVRGYPCVLHAGHTRADGIRNMAALTGSARLREAADEFGENRARISTVLLPTLNHRGYNVGSFFKLYEMECNPFYLNAARIHFEHMVFDLDPANGTGYTNVPLGYQGATGDPRAETIRTARIRSVSWDSRLKLKVGIPHHPLTQMKHGPAALGGEAYLVTRDPKYRTILREDMEYSLSHTPRSALRIIDGTLGRLLPSWTYYLDAAEIKDVRRRELPPETKAALEENLRLGLEN